jgi:hypothetical protein
MDRDFGLRKISAPKPTLNQSPVRIYNMTSEEAFSEYERELDNLYEELKNKNFFNVF